VSIYKKVCQECGKEFESTALNSKFCKDPRCRKICKNGGRGKQKKIVEKKQPGVVYIRIRGSQEYVPPQLSREPQKWVPVVSELKEPKKVIEEVNGDLDSEDREERM
jgi:hypothetical protein